MNTENTIEIEVPFSGFYHSVHDMHIDNWVDFMLEGDEAEYLGITHDELSDKLYSMDYSKIREAMCKHYIQAYNAIFYDNFNIELDLKFSEMTSPKFYNFETDRLYCTIEKGVFDQVVALLDDDKIQETLSDKYKSHSGYHVFDSTLQAIQDKDYQLFSSDILEMLLPELDVTDHWEYADNIREVIENSADYEV